MDTKYWGPSGWRLLHLIAEKEASDEKYWSPSHERFWAVLPYILPCKFCRTSLTTYYEKYPIPQDPSQMGRWLYKIHNCVNDKLRSQGQTIPTPPPYSVVKKHYRNMLEQDCTELSFPGWEFLFCIADNYPTASGRSAPMPDTPADLPSDLDVKTKNKYNLLSNEERIGFLGEFWASLAPVMPFVEWRRAMEKYCDGPQECVRDFRGSSVAKARLWRIKCALDSVLGKKSAESYYDLCRAVASKRSGCSSSPRARTCRAVQTKRQKTTKKKHDKK